MARLIESIDHDIDRPIEDWISPDEGRRMFDEAARTYAGISGEEFIRRFDAGEYAAIPDNEQNRMIVELGMLVDVDR